MASMTYCMFENTVLEMEQVTNAMEEVNSWEDMDLNEYEKRAKKHLYDLCVKYIEEYQWLEESEDIGAE